MLSSSFATLATISSIFLLIQCKYCISLTIKDLYTPDACENTVQLTHHLLIDYKVILANGTVGLSMSAPNQLFHIQLSNIDGALPIIAQGLLGSCQNSTRDFIFENAFNVDFSPFLRPNSTYSQLQEQLTIRIHISHITTEEDFAIFDAFNSMNTSLALDIIEEHRGVNAVDEWGQSSLMFSVANKNNLVFAALMNTRRPMVNVNFAKSSGFTALYYAVEHAPLSIVQALLRRGADPNTAALQEGSKGNTPLHFACLLEKPKTAEALMEYGANIMAVNEHGQTPFQLIPSNAVKSIKLHFLRIFQAAEALKNPPPTGTNRNSEL